MKKKYHTLCTLRNWLNPKKVVNRPDNNIPMARNFLRSIFSASIPLKNMETAYERRKDVSRRPRIFFASPSLFPSNWFIQAWQTEMLRLWSRGQLRNEGALLTTERGFLDRWNAV